LTPTDVVHIVSVVGANAVAPTSTGVSLKIGRVASVCNRVPSREQLVGGVSMQHRLALVGFGVVGHGLVELLRDKRAALRGRYGFDFEVVAVTDLRLGSAYDADGLDLDLLLQSTKDRSLDGYPRGEHGMDAVSTIRDTNSTVVVEATFTNIETGEPAYTHFKAALEAGKHLATTNKGPVTLHLDDLEALARARGVQLRYEGTVLSGTPCINLAQLCLSGADISEIRGIVNGTTNYILTQMEHGREYADALRQAQDLGYAEAKPDADVEGWDAVAKVVIMGRSLMGLPVCVADVEREGITAITKADVEAVLAEGERFKLLATVRRQDGGFHASVQPRRVPLDDPLASVMGPINAVTFVTDTLGDVTMVGPGAGRRDTGYALLADLLDIHRHVSHQP
jgi:homoserine dehydrogenase